MCTILLVYLEVPIYVSYKTSLIYKYLYTYIKILPPQYYRALNTANVFKFSTCLKSKDRTHAVLRTTLITLIPFIYIWVLYICCCDDDALPALWYTYTIAFICSLLKQPTDLIAATNIAIISSLHLGIQSQSGQIA